MTDNHIEKALRTVMERRAERVPALSDDFAQQVMAKMNVRKEVKRHRASTPLHYGRLGSLEQPLNVAAAPQRGANPHSRRRAGWGWACSIAAVLLIAFLLWPQDHEKTMTQQEAQPDIAEASQQSVTAIMSASTSQAIPSTVEHQPQAIPASDAKHVQSKERILPSATPIDNVQQEQPIAATSNQLETDVALMEVAQADLDIQKRVQAIETATQAQAEQAFEVAVAAVLCSREPS